MNDLRIEREIDRAVRRMVAVCPPTDLRARVLARIEKRPQPVAWIPAVCGAAAAALVVGVLMQHAFAPAPLVPPHPRGDRMVSSAVAPPQPDTARRGAVLIAPRARAPRVLDLDREGVRAARLPPLPDGPPPIEVGELAVAPPAALDEIEPPAIVIAPLAEPADVVVEPLAFTPEGQE